MKSGAWVMALVMLGCGGGETEAGSSGTSAASSSASSATTPAQTSTSVGTGEASTAATTVGSSGASTDTTSGADSGSEGSGSTTGEPPVSEARCGDPRLGPARPSFAAPIELSGGGGTGGSAAGDLDGDGRDEFVAQIRFRIYDFDGKAWQTFEPLPDLSGRGNRFAGDIEVADVDADGDLDIVVPDSDNSGSTGALSWFENPGQLEGAWNEHVVSTFGGDGDEDTVTHLSELEVADLEGDGDVDFVVRDISHGVWIFVQEPDGWAPRVYVPTLPREGLELWDLEGDGDLDIVLNGVWLQTPEDPAAGPWEVRPIEGMEAWYAPDLSTPSVRDYASKVEVGDFDADGRPDVAITNAEELASNSPNKPRGISVFLQPDDLDQPWTEIAVTAEHWSWHTLQLGDFDHDGALDLLTAISAVGTDGAGDEIALWINDGTGTAFSGQSISTEHTVYQGRIGDADGDGDCDLLAPDHFNSGPVRFFENTTY